MSVHGWSPFSTWRICSCKAKQEFSSAVGFQKSKLFCWPITLLNFCLHRFAGTNLPRGKRAKRGARLERRTGRQVKTLPDLNFCYIRMSCVWIYANVMQWESFGLGLIQPRTQLLLLHYWYVRVHGVGIWPKFYLSWKAGIVFLV